MIGLTDIEDAARRIKPHIRRKPTVQAAVLCQPVTEAALWLKLECLQPTGSFKASGAVNRLLTTPREALVNGIVTASGGNHGLATAPAAQFAGVPASIFVPSTVTPAKLDKLRRWNATVELVGSVWDETNRRALAIAAERGAAYFQPFADPAVVAGQGTSGIELIAELPDVDTVIVSIGGWRADSRHGDCTQSLEARSPYRRRRAVRFADAPRLARRRRNRHSCRGQDARDDDGLRPYRRADIRDRPQDSR